MRFALLIKNIPNFRVPSLFEMAFFCFYFLAKHINM